MDINKTFKLEGENHQNKPDILDQQESPGSFKERIQLFLEKELEARGYRLVFLNFFGKKKKTLRVALEHLDERPISLEECAEVSRGISLGLDVENFFQQSYILEVASPGLDRPLNRLSDYKRFDGRLVEMNLSLEDGKKTLKGSLEGCDDHGVVLKQNQEDIKISWNHIARCKLVPDFPQQSKHKKESKKRRGVR